jgi:hypothetical protein
MCARVSLGSDLQRCVLESRNVGGKLGDKARRQFALLCNACGQPSCVILDVLRAKYVKLDI